ncbi:FecCD family ABC transporter permease [Qingshengfaniella alkalisoli]|uniref:Iron ABC transporter permease n=1 Tax=Qingshengfaniella alkalisoli TaxID=2599296 RepID=A0A5B8J2Q7_9RHOB|nr:iron ABC transporter permease [Qingshengfaniella alkalisoli]QDY71048.1 iron ABC transporter permease [Qingshengfaniella alkalisoli]
MTFLRIICIIACLLACAMVLSLHAGLRLYSPDQVWQALQGGQTPEDLIIRTLRVPRTLIGACVGAMLGLSGLLMQGATRNPLAEPGLLGVNSGAALAVVILMVTVGVTGLSGIAAAAGVGALLTVIAVFLMTSLGGRGMDPTTVLLTGVTFAAMFGAITNLLLLVDEAAMETLLFWLAGGFADRSLFLLWLGVPVLVTGTASALALSTALDVLRTDDASAAAVGVPVLRIRLASLALAALLAAAAVAMAGPIAFLGLVAPHIARRLCADATEHRKLIILSLLTGALLAVTADIVARIIVAPGEAPITTVLAVVGVPALISLLRRSRVVTA